MHPSFDKKVTLQVHNRFNPKADIAEVVTFVREQKVPGKVEIVLPGNGGITSVEFIESPKIHKADVPIIEVP
jgi:hypothetical protein